MDKDTGREAPAHQKAPLLFNRRTFVGMAAVGTASVLAGSSLGFTPAFANPGDATVGINTADSGLTAMAGEPIMLASFFGSNADMSSTLYTSHNGTFFEKIGVAYQDRDPNSPSDNRVENAEQKYGHDSVYALSDPSIIYRDGLFLMLSGYTNHDILPGQIIPMIGYSRDLVSWSEPGSQQAISVAEYPPIAGSGIDPSRFNMVAPDWFTDDDGTIWLVASLGFYGAFNNSPFADTMFPYLSKITSLEPSGASVSISAEPAKPIRLPIQSNDRIDGSLFKENGVYYLIIKNNGITNEIWSTPDLNRCDDPNAWTLVNGNAVTGYEGPSLARMGNLYNLYTDKLIDWPPDLSDTTTGIHVTRSSNLAAGWTTNRRIIASDVNGDLLSTRHGTVITLTGEAADVVRAQRRAAGWREYDSATDFDDVNLDYARNGGAPWYVADGWLPYVVSNGIMSGYSDTSNNFGPYDFINRGQVAVILYRHATGLTAETTNNNIDMPFNDVPSGMYYTAAIEWAKNEGIITGYPASNFTEFGPENAVTREELATMIARYAGTRGQVISGADPTVFNSLLGVEKVSEFAQESMIWCCAQGIIGGVSDLYLDPQEPAWRAAMAKMIKVTSDIIG